jgi:DtxR family Mn-dependent transcriptional regulator
MELEEKAEEILETLWIETSEKRRETMPLAELGRVKKPLEQLEKTGYISLSDGQITLTGKGRPEARSVVRRHRLAERLLHDVLGTGDKLMHDKACKFEHLLDKGLDESVCHLLGHPKICPHGKPIPPGRCCQHGKTQVQKLVSPLSQLAQGQTGKVAYIYAPETSRLQKLMAMGILPGAPIRLLQSFPSYVFAAGQTQFAVDKDIADAIYVRLMEEEAAGPEEAPPQSRPHRRRFGLWGRHRQDS